MDKKNILNKIASAFGRKGDNEAEPTKPVEPVTPKQSESEPEVEPAPKVEPTVEPVDEPSLMPIGDVMESISPETAPDDRLNQSMADAIALADRAGHMLEAQAKQQQQVTDAVTELSSKTLDMAEQLTSHGDALDAIQRLLGRSDQSSERLTQQVEDTAERLAATGKSAARMTEGLTALTGMVDDLGRSVAQHQRQQAEALAEFRGSVNTAMTTLRWLIIAAAGIATLIATVVLRFTY